MVHPVLSFPCDELGLTTCFSLLLWEQTCCLVSHKSLPTLPSSIGKSDTVLDHTAKTFSFEITQVKQSLLLLSSICHWHSEQNTWRRNNIPKTWSQLVCSQFLGNSPRQVSPISSNLLISDFLSKGTTWGWARGLSSAFSLVGNWEEGQKDGWRRGAWGKVMNLLLNTNKTFSGGRLPEF